MDLRELVRLSLIEDVGPGDVTTVSCVPDDARGRASIRAKQRLVVCGHAAAAEVFSQTGACYEGRAMEGEIAEPGRVVAEVTGPLRSLLTGERVALNFLMRLCGVATHTRAVMEQAPPGLRVVDTRKTTPLLRALERRAVVVGGAANHRFALFDGILIKDNHIKAAGGIAAAVSAARKNAHHLLRIEIEVESRDEARQAVSAGADVVMLDNMTDDEMAAVIAALGDRVIYEASGNITAERLPRLAEIGVSVVSIGGLIHQARWADLSMKIG